MKKLSAVLMSVSAIVVLGAAVGSTSASASALCPTAPESHVCPSPYPEGTPFTASSEDVSFNFGWTGSQKCKSTIKGTIQKNYAGEYWVNDSSLTLAECRTTTPTVLNSGYWNFSWVEGTDNGITDSNYTELQVNSLGYSCVYYGFPWNKAIKLEGGNPAKIVVYGYKMYNGGYPAFPCGQEPGLMYGTYTINSPAPLYVEKE